MHVVQGMRKSRRVLRKHIFWPQMSQMSGPVGRLLGRGRPQLGLVFGDAPSFNAVHAVVALAAESDVEVAAIAAIAAATNKAAVILRFSLVSGPTAWHVWLKT